MVFKHTKDLSIHKTQTEFHTVNHVSSNYHHTN